MADGQAVRFRYFEHIVRRQGTAGTGHVIDDDRWTTRDMVAEMTGDQARVGIVTAAGGSADNNANCFAFVIRRGGMQIVRRSDGYGEDRKKLDYPPGNSQKRILSEELFDYVQALISDPSCPSITLVRHLREQTAVTCNLVMKSQAQLRFPCARRAGMN